MFMRTLHVSGSKDVVNPPRCQMLLMNRFCPRLSVWHSFPGGHVVPQNNEFVDVLEQFLDNIDGVTREPSTVPASGLPRLVEP